MRALVTGGAGFIGRHLTRALLDQGIRVTVLDTAVPDDLFGIDHVSGSVLDDTLVAGLVPRADFVVHLAGIAEPMRYGSDPLGTLDVNLLGSINVIRRCAACRVPILFASTSEIYGINQALPWAEDADRVLGPVSNVRWCYASAKATVEHYLDACRRQLGLDYTVVRLFNTYGAGLKGRVVDRFIRSALSGEPLAVNGDGEQTRCFCYVDDVVDALVRIVTHPREVSRTYNIGGDIEISIVDFAHRVVELSHSSSSVVLVPHTQLYDGYQDVRRRRPDIGAIRRDLGWTPSTSLDDGLHRMIAAMRDIREPADAA